MLRYRIAAKESTHGLLDSVPNTEVVVGEAMTGEEAIELAEALLDVIFMSSKMSGTNDIATMREMYLSHPGSWAGQAVEVGRSYAPFPGAGVLVEAPCSGSTLPVGGSAMEVSKVTFPERART